MTSRAAADDVPDWAARANRLADELVAAGKLWSAEWQAAVRGVPRHVFVPRFHEQRQDRLVVVSGDDPETAARWRERVYANAALVTRVGGGADGGWPEFLSSSSTPGLMTRMLESLDIRDGQRVLEIGTGTGYNAGLLCHRLGDGRVFSVDVEPDLVAAARDRLAGLGYRPTLVAADGAGGLPEHAPFDRVIATCSVPSIPWAWVAQTRVGGVILGDVRAGTGAGNLVRLTRVGADRAEGRFEAGQASFMSLRHAPGPSVPTGYVRAADTPVIRSTTRLDPRTPWSSPVVWFLAALRIGPHHRLGYRGADPVRAPSAVTIATPDGSSADVTIAPGAGGHAVRESGPVRLWRLIEAAHERWESAGSPGWSRLGLVVTPGHQALYVDSPDTVLSELVGG